MGGTWRDSLRRDRSLSQVSLPAALREAGLIVHTLAEIYGEKRAQFVEDTEWLALAALIRPIRGRRYSR